MFTPVLSFTDINSYTLMRSSNAKYLSFIINNPCSYIGLIVPVEQRIGDFGNLKKGRFENWGL